MFTSYSFCRLQNPTLAGLSPGRVDIRVLEPIDTVLFINMPVPLLLLPVLEYHGNTQDKKGIHTNDTECRGEDQIEVLVSK